MKKVVIIKTSLRNNSNSDILADEFIRGANDANNEIQVISLKNKKINFCIGCLSCQKTKKCFMGDDAIDIADKVCNADVVVWATPIYYYSVSGQMKTLIDRMNSLYARDYKFREVYLLATSAEAEEETINGAIKEVEGWVSCFNNVILKNHLLIGDVNSPKDILNNPNLVKAYNMGKEL